MTLWKKLDSCMLPPSCSCKLFGNTVVLSTGLIQFVSKDQCSDGSFTYYSKFHYNVINAMTGRSARKACCWPRCAVTAAYCCVVLLT